MKKTITLLFTILVGYAQAQNADSIAIRKIYNEALANGKSYEWLRYLTKQIGPRLSGSAGGTKSRRLDKAGNGERGFRPGVFAGRDGAPLGTGR